MNQIDGTLILLVIPLCLLLNGYWAAAMLPDNNALERLSFALLFGFMLALAAVAAVNFFYPLAGPWAYACLAPVVLTLILPRSLTGLFRDIREIALSRPGWVIAALALFLVLLLWPVLIAPSSLFYDGTSNHDSFFWVAAAEHLKRHAYMEAPLMSSTQPMFNAAKVITGWSPDWGRMGAEGLLALTSSVINVSPLKLYLYATGSLFLVWIAGAYLALKTFVTEKPGRVAGIALVCLQPLFIFFYGNSNLPNLLGALCAGAMVIAVERALRARLAGHRDSNGYLILIALAFQGLLCSYPEMVPFVLLSAGLLWVRPWFSAGFKKAWWPCVLVSGAIMLGAALNLVTTTRAVHGFLESFKTARANENWANLFNPLEIAEYGPALVTLSVPAAKELGPWFGWPLTVVIAAAIVLMLRRSRDRWGVVAIFAGGAALLTYTIVNDFAYGWQKTVQFAGIFVGMAFPAAAADLLSTSIEGANRLNRQIGRVSLVGLLVFLGFATLFNLKELHKWSDRKVISADWFTLRDLSRTTLSQAPVLVEAATFRMAFFHGMWAAYFLPDSHIYYGARGEESGGYLRSGVINEQDHEIPHPAAVLVGHDWADAFDANSPRIFTGREYTLLKKSNRVFKLAGVFPLNGVPDHFSGAATMEILPHSPSNLLLELAPRAKVGWPAGAWQLTRTAEGAEDFTATVTGASPWHLVIPLVAGSRNQVTITLAGNSGLPSDVSFLVRSLRIEDSP